MGRTRIPHFEARSPGEAQVQNSEPGSLNLNNDIPTSKVPSVIVRAPVAGLAIDLGGEGLVADG